MLDRHFSWPAQHLVMLECYFSCEVHQLVKVDSRGAHLSTQNGDAFMFGSCPDHARIMFESSAIANDASAVFVGG